MAPYYEFVCKELKWKMDSALFDKMCASNKEVCDAHLKKLEDATANLGETEVLDCLIEQASFLTQIGDKEKALSAFRVCSEKAITLGMKLDIILCIMRIGFMFNDQELISRNLEKAHALLEEGGDWDRRNRLRVYEGIYLFTIRDFRSAAELLVESFSTFSALEFLSYTEFVKYAVISALYSFDRKKLFEKVVNSSEVLEVLHEIPFLQNYLNSFYNCDYKLFFESLASIEGTFKRDRIIAPHYKYLVKEMRIKAYSQLLESYRSLTLDSMARAFGVTVEFIDKYLLLILEKFHAL